MDYEYPERPTLQESTEFSKLSQSIQHLAEVAQKIPEYIGKPPKLCPFRKKIYFMASNSTTSWSISSSKADFMKEEFQPCLGEECMLYNWRREACGRE